MKYQDLIQACQQDWQDYTEHDFVKTLANGTLAQPCFLHYLKQDFLFLKQYARAYALAIYKAKTLADMRRALPSVHALLDSEISHHVTYCGQWGLTESDLENEPEDFGTVAYTRYVLDAGMTGDLVDLYAALAPCSIGYAVIGKALLESSDTVLEGNPYASWLQLYGGEEFQSGVATGAEYFNQLLAEIDINSERGQNIVHIFKTATRMEVAFWQQGLNALDDSTATFTNKVYPMLTEQIIQSLRAVREQKPLVVNITNYVVMNNTANALLAIGASPIMAHSQQELAEMMSFSGALVINIGTLDSVWTPRMCFAVEQANANNKVVVLDPVGCGASTLRTETSREIARLADKLIIRGNASEIIALAGEQAHSKGVDALDSSDAALGAAQCLVAEYGANVVISGETDYVVTKDSVVTLNNGHPMMPYVTGMGCTLTALTGAFAAIGDDNGLAAAAVLGVVGEIAAENSRGPGSLQMNLLDELYQLDEETLIQRLKIQ